MNRLHPAICLLLHVQKIKKNTQIKALDFEFVELMKINIGDIEIDLQAV